MERALRMKNKLAKCFCFVCTIAILIYIITYTTIFFRANRPQTLLEWLESNPEEAGKLNLTRPLGSILKYILQWSPGSVSPFDFMGQGQSVFIAKNCTYQNCFVTDDRSFLYDYRLFHAIAFNGHQVINAKQNDLPKLRSNEQKYIFAAMESADNYPACSPYLDGFFNWTWTYRLDSDVRWGYITFYHKNGSLAGPKRDMIWPKNFSPVGDEIKQRLKNKNKAAAWLVSNCATKSKREFLADKIENELEKYGLTLDTFGRCGKRKCDRSKWKDCLEMLERNYYFYFSFENSFAEDYVTEKVLSALNYFTVPIVYGAANYSRFLPPGSYLNAKELSPEDLAKKMADIINNTTAYHDFFRWRNHYTYTETSSTVDVCNLCALLNDDKKFNTFSSYKEFRKWWNPDGACSWTF